jgi:elongation factor G
MERYLEGEEIEHDEIVSTLKDGTNHGSLFPVVCGVATRNLATNRLLDAIVDDLPSPVKHGGLQLPEVTLEAREDAPLYAYVFKTRADPFAGRINLFRVYQGVMRHDTQVMNTRTHGKERLGQLLVFSGRDSGHADEFGPGDIGAVAKLKETRAGDWLAERDDPISMPQIKLPAPVMAFAMEAQGDEDKVFTSLRRLQEEDPTIDLHRDEQTGDQIIAGLSQMHVEVIVDRLRERFGAEVRLKPPRVPYQETIRKPAKAHGRHKKQSGGRGQFGDCHISIEPRPAGAGFEFINQIKGGVIPTSFIPAVEKGVLEAMQTGPIAGCPVKDVAVTLFDGSYHTVDSSEMAFKLAGSIAMREAMANAAPVLLEPIMLVTLTIPEESVGDVIGDLNSRRGRPQGMDSVGGGLTEVKAEVPMSEMLTYAPDLRSLTGGQGDYTMEFLRYEEVPAHLQQKIVEQAAQEEAVSA